MTGLCLVAVGFAVNLPLQAFTLSWTHSIEKIKWEEDYRIVDSRLELVEARIRGSGAGMEPPEGAILKNGVWHYKPAIPLQERLLLTRSPYVADYSLCWDGICRPMADIIGPADKPGTAELFSCSKSSK